MVECLLAALCITLPRQTPAERVETLLAVAYDVAIPVECVRLPTPIAGEVAFVRADQSAPWQPQTMRLLPWVCDSLVRRDERTNQAAHIAAHEAGHVLLGVSEQDAEGFATSNWSRIAAQVMR